MKTQLKLTNILLFLFVFIFYACDSSNTNAGKGSVTFGANSHRINCATIVTVYIDDEKIGDLSDSTDEITECGEATNITKELPVGEYSYKVEVRGQFGTGCKKDIEGTFSITENGCEKIFIDYNEIFKCEQKVVINLDEYQEIKTPDDKIGKIEIIGNCLHIMLQDSGCDGNSWKAKLVDSGTVGKSSPAQRFLRLSFENNEDCLAFIGKEFSFDIESLQVAGGNKLTLNVGNKSILYEY